MNMIVKRFEELTAGELYRILALRDKVFVVEQACIYQEADGKDLRAYHVWMEEDGEIAAYLRVLEAGVSYDEVSIGRVIAVKRRQGYGSRIVAEGIRVAREKLGAKAIRIEAQTYARGLYEKLGFVQTTEEFLDDGIPHIGMLLEME
ncbi:MAG: GNAT family N-acetyltransferase [Clostridia bacterium]|nr:GNAT family N-acetyltransferase [Clostridia bacterium]